jgi:hypothetical protein
MATHRKPKIEEVIEKVAVKKAERSAEFEMFKHEIVISWQAGEHTKSLPLHVTQELIAALDNAYDLGKKA